MNLILEYKHFEFKENLSNGSHGFSFGICFARFARWDHFQINPKKMD